MSLQPHQQRVIDEKSELDERLAKLVIFMGTELCLSLPFAERGRLKRQASAMKDYTEVLAERIAAFE
jgi:hypothetical protein